MRWEEMTSDNPWQGIEPPNSTGLANARRVSADLPWDFFWARDSDRGVLLTLRHNRASTPQHALPNLRGIDVALSPLDDSGSRTLVFKLLDHGQQQIFLTLCRDIITAASIAESEIEAVSVALLRTWRWHHLLRGGSPSGLSSIEQMGLLGEFQVLENLLIPALGSANAVAAWRGPLGFPKDFEVGFLAIEAKAHRVGSSPQVTISSEFQLDNQEGKVLFLSVLALSSAPAGTSEAVSVRDVADRIARRILSESPEASGSFEELLVASGLRPEDDYSNDKWVVGESRLYHVRDEFPRIMGSDLRPGVTNVRYQVSLHQCSQFLTSVSHLENELLKSGETYAN